MNRDLREIAESFDARSSTYARNEWHLRCAERLVTLCELNPGACVLDAATGTGFVAIAAARAVGNDGVVIGVDISPGMLREARAALAESAISNVEFHKGDAAHLPEYDAERFDAVLCGAGLLYMPVADALREWRRILKRGGRVAFSTMAAGSPPSARIFRECARTFGVSLPDASAPLGTEKACEDALKQTGYAENTVVRETLEFSRQDIMQAWEANINSPAHAAVRNLSAGQQSALKGEYLRMLAELERNDSDALHTAEILFAIGRKLS